MAILGISVQHLMEIYWKHVECKIMLFVKALIYNYYHIFELLIEVTDFSLSGWIVTMHA